MDYLFAGCSSLININIDNFNTSLVTNMNNMFYNCISLTSLNLINFDTEKVLHMNGLFYNCKSLTSLNLNNFNISKVISLNYLFYGCSSLKSLIISNFDTSKITSMNYMFYGCSSLKSLNISNFDTSYVLNMNYMFYGCHSLEILNFQNFNSLRLSYFKNILYDCENLKFINFKNAKIDENGLLKIFYNFTNNISVCLNNHSNILVDKNNSHIYDNIKFVSCDDNCKNDFPFKNIMTEECLEYCNINQLYQNICISNDKNTKYLHKIIKNGMSNFDISSLKNKTFIEIKVESTIFKLINSNLINKNIFNYENIGKCVNLLKINYNISKDDFLIVLMINNYDKNNQISGTKYEFYSSLYDNSLMNLNSSLCGDILEETNISNYLDNDTNLKCYDSCETCDIPGDNKTHHCKTCKKEYPFRLKKYNYINCYEFCHYNIYDEINDIYYCLEEPICIGANNKLIPEKNYSCIDDCTKDNIYKYDFQNICYKECPINISESSTDNQYKCELKCSVEAPFENIKNQQCRIKCDINDIFNNKCRLNYNEKEDKEDMTKQIIENIKNGTMEEVISQILTTGDSLIYTEGEDAHLLSTVNGNLKRSDYSSIDFGPCEKLIREKNNILDTEELLLYQVEHSVEGLNIPILEYVIFTEDGKTQLDLSICDNMQVQYYIPVSINEKDIDKYDPSSEFYNDECNKHSTESGVDMTLYDRKNEFNNKNMSLCEKNCVYKGLDIETGKVECDCNIKSNMTYFNNETNIDDLLSKIDEEKNANNLKVTRCLNEVLEMQKIQSNSGFIIIAIILIIFIIVCILFYMKGKQALINTIDEIIFKKFSGKKININVGGNMKIIKINNIQNQEQPNIKKETKIIINNSKINSNINFMNVNEQNDKNNLNLGLQRNEEYIHYYKKMMTKENNANNSSVVDKLDIESDYELNTLAYAEAITYDKRTFCEYYTSLLKKKQLFYFAFCTFNDYNSSIIKKFIFLLSFAIHYTINALFFNDDNMHQIYEDKGSYNISYQFPYILISTLISIVIMRIMLEMLILTDKDILKVKQQNTKDLAENMKLKVIKCLNIKFSIFFILNFILLILFWFYLTCFNGIYGNTQIYLMKNTLISFSISLVLPFFWNIIPSLLRIISLNPKKCDSEKLYSASKICQLI